MGIVPRSALAWEGFPIDGFQLFAGTGDVVHYHLDFSLTCPVPSNFAARVQLPDGWLYKPGTTRWRYGTGTPVTGANPTTTSRSGARWSDLPGTPCPAGAASRPVELTFDALSGLTLGVEEATASVTMGADDADDRPAGAGPRDAELGEQRRGHRRADDPAEPPGRRPHREERRRRGVPPARADRARDPHDRVPQPHGGGRRLRPRRREARRAVAAVEPRRLDPGRLDPGRGRGQLDRQSERSASARDAAGHPGRLDPRREHLREPRLRGRGGAGRRRRRGGLLHDHGQRLQRLAQRHAVRPARRADAASRASGVPGARAHARRPWDACGAGCRHEDALHRQPPANDGAPRCAGDGRHARRRGQGGRQARGRRADPRGRRRRGGARGVRRVGRAAVLDRRSERRGRGGQRRRRPVPRRVAERALRRPPRLRRRAPDDAAPRPRDDLERDGGDSRSAVHASERQRERSLRRRGARLLPERQRVRRVHDDAVAGPRPVSPERRRRPARRDRDGHRAPVPALREQGRTARPAVHAHDRVRLPHGRRRGGCRRACADRRRQQSDQRHLDLGEPRDRVHEQPRPGRRALGQRALQPLAPAAGRRPDARLDGRSARRRRRVRAPASSSRWAATPG